MLIAACCGDDRDVLRREEAAVAQIVEAMQRMISTGSMPTAWIMLRICTCRAESPRRRLAGRAAAFVSVCAMSRLPVGQAATPVGVGHDVLLRDRAAARSADLALDVPSRMTSTRSQMPMISGSSLEITMTPMSRLRELVDDPVDLRLGADVDAAGRLVEDQHLGADLEPAGRAAPSAGCRPRGCRPGPAGSPPRMRSALNAAPRARRGLGEVEHAAAARRPARSRPD